MEATRRGGSDDASTLRGACASVTALISYLRCEVGARDSYVTGQRVVEAGGWIRCGELIDDVDSLSAVIRSTGEQLGTDDQMVAASLFVQNYAYRVLTLAVACATVAGVVPNARAQSMAFTLSSGRPATFAYTDPSLLVLWEEPGGAAAAFGRDTTVAAFLEYLIKTGIDEHVAPIVTATHGRFRIGERLLWGNVAASAAVAFRTMEGVLGPWVQRLGEAFFDAAPQSLQGLGSFLALENGDRRGWYWERLNCCLHDRLPSRLRCGDCSRTPIEERRAAYRASLEP